MKTFQKNKTAKFLTGVSGFALTPIERAHGRLMRAPDHDAGGAAGASGDGAAAGDAGAAGAAGGEGGAAGGAGAAGEGQGTSLAGGAGEAAAGAGEGDAGKEAPAGEGDAGKSGEEGDGKEAAKPETLGAPEKYELKAPDGMEFDAEAFGEVEPILRELDLSPVAAQKLVDAYAGKVIPLLQKRAEQGAVQAAEERNAAYRKTLADEARADPEIGGAKFDETIDRVARVWQQFGIPAGSGFRGLLDDSGLGNHPDMLRFLSRVGAAVSEGSFVRGDGGGGGRKSDTEVFYGTPAQ